MERGATAGRGEDQRRNVFRKHKQNKEQDEINFKCYFSLLKEVWALTLSTTGFSKSATAKVPSVMLEHINTGQVPCEGTSSLASCVCIIFCNSNIFLQHLPIYKNTINNNNVFITLFYMWVRYQIPKKKQKNKIKDSLSAQYTFIYRIPFMLSCTYARNLQQTHRLWSKRAFLCFCFY